MESSGTNDLDTTTISPKPPSMAISMSKSSPSSQIIDQRTARAANISIDIDREEIELDDPTITSKDYLEVVSHEADLNMADPLQDPLGNNIVADPNGTESIKPRVNILDPKSTHALSVSTISSSFEGKCSSI